MGFENRSKAIVGVLIADQGNAAIAGSGKLLIGRDLDGDGLAATPGEVTSFFDATNASGLAAPSENIFSVFQARDRSVFAANGDTDTIYRLVDRNNDGDANDAGEAKVWFSPANAGGFSTVTPNGIAQGKDGAIYITNAGVNSAPADMIYRTVDLNGDGDADDAGEATVWLDLQQVIATSVPFDIAFDGKVAYVADLTGAAEDVIHRVEDRNGNGRIDAGEVTTFASDSGAFGAPIDIALDVQDGSLLSLSWTASGGAPHRLYRLTDLDNSGSIDQPAESVEVWNSTFLPAGFGQAAGFSVSAAKNGGVVLAVNGGTPATKNVYLLNDFDGDGLYTSRGETQIYASNSFDSGSLYRPRGVEFYNDDLDFSLIRGTARSDWLAGSRDGETIVGLKGDDKLFGLGGDDVLWGGLGNDILSGDGGADVLRGGTGRDVLTGGAGGDRFVFAEGDGAGSHDVILDFRRGVDKIELDGLGIESIEGTLLGAKVTFDDGSDVLVALTRAASLQASDFVFSGGAVDDFFV
ncbi:MAG: hypothetical protein ABTQ27_10320 [Amaricoccus sp.]|uniref:calcium-binding protein n=1 Tax=Amaricoccus sp. TaxID=1872485 RepID=UPI003315D4CE